MSTYNGERFLAEQLDSILAQTEPDWRLSVSDDGSCDGTIGILEAYAGKDDRIRFRRNERNLGPAANFYLMALDVAAEGDRNRWYCFADQDDVWLPEKLATLAEVMSAMDQRGFPVALYSDVCLIDENGEEIAPSYYGAMHVQPHDADLAHMLMENKMIGQTMMVNHALLEVALANEKKTGHIPKHMIMHDWWFALIAAAFGKAYDVGKVLGRYRQHGSNAIGGTDFMTYVKSRAEKIPETRQKLLADIRQGQEFLELFGDELDPQKKEILEAFARLDRCGKMEKLAIIHRYGFYKSGMTRRIMTDILV